jgi:hypothetical protein
MSTPLPDPTATDTTAATLFWDEVIPVPEGEARSVFVARHEGRTWITDRIGILADADVLAERISEPLPDLDEGDVWFGSTAIDRHAWTEHRPELAAAVAAAWHRKAPAAADLDAVLTWTEATGPVGRVATTADRRRTVTVPAHVQDVIARLGATPVLGTDEWGVLITGAEPPRVIAVIRLSEPQDQ